MIIAMDDFFMTDKDVHDGKVEVPSFGCGASPSQASRAGRGVGWDLGDEEPRTRPTDPGSGEHVGLWAALHTTSPWSLGTFKGRRVGSNDGRPPPGVLFGGPERTASATSRWLTHAPDELRLYRRYCG